MNENEIGLLRMKAKRGLLTPEEAEAWAAYQASQATPPPEPAPIPEPAPAQEKTERKMPDVERVADVGRKVFGVALIVVALVVFVPPIFKLGSAMFSTVIDAGEDAQTVVSELQGTSTTVDRYDYGDMARIYVCGDRLIVVNTWGRDSYGIVPESYDSPLRYSPSGTHVYATCERVSLGNGDGYEEWRALDENGEPFGEVYASFDDVPQPDWYVASKAAYEAYPTIGLVATAKKGSHGWEWQSALEGVDLAAWLRAAGAPEGASFDELIGYLKYDLGDTATSLTGAWSGAETCTGDDRWVETIEDSQMFS